MRMSNLNGFEKLRRGYFAVHYPKWVSAVFEKELEETTTDALNAGGGVEITAVRDDRFLGEVLKALLNRLKGEVFDSDTSLTKAIHEVLDTVSQGQTLFGRIKQGGLGAQAYRRSRFLKTAGDTYVINWARTFIKEFYPATLSKRGNSYSLVHDKRTDLLLSSFKCWLLQHIEAEPPKLTTAFDALEPQVELKEQVRERRKSGSCLKQSQTNSVSQSIRLPNGAKTSRFSPQLKRKSWTYSGMVRSGKHPTSRNNPNSRDREQPSQSKIF